MAKLTKERKLELVVKTKNGRWFYSDVLQELLDEIDALTPIYEAAKQLRDSGYDGPFIGEVCEPLFSALAEYERQ